MRWGLFNSATQFVYNNRQQATAKKKTCERGYFFARCLRVYYVESQEMVAVKIKLHFFCFSGNDTFQELLVLRARDISTLQGCLLLLQVWTVM